jgi:Domain of unknown function (DUF4184)
MPFTVAHAAAALPFRRLKLVWSAFVIGSMAPDVPYVVGNLKYRTLGHYYPGVLLFTLPASLIALWFFHLGIKQPVAGLLPIGMQQRLTGQLGEFKFGGISRFAAITFSIALGIATHLVWDAITHPFTWPWRHWAWLRSTIEFPVGGWMQTYAVLQYASTIIGLLVLAIWILLWYRKTAPDVSAASQRPLKSRVPIAVGICASAVTIGVLRASLLIGEMPRTRNNWDWFTLNFAVTALAATFWLLLLYSLLTTSLNYQHTAKVGET